MTGPDIAPARAGGPEPATPKKRSRWPAIIGFLAILCACLVAIALALLGRDAQDGDARDGQPSSTSTVITKDEAPRIKLSWDTVETGREIFAAVETTEAAAKGKMHRRLTLENGKIVKVEAIDPAGLVQSTTTARYEADGSSELTTVDGRGTLQDVTRTSKDGIRTTVARSGSPFMNGCARQAIVFTPAGDAQSLTCQNAEGQVIADADGCPVTAFERNEHHHVVAERCLAEDGSPLEGASGVHLYRSTLDAIGQTTERSYFDAGGTPVSDSHDCAGERYEYDAAGNRTFVACIGAAGSSSAIRGASVAGQRYTYDEHGCEIRLEFIDASGNPAVLAGMSARVTANDVYCGELSEQTVDASGALVMPPAAVARREYLLDPKGDITQLSCFDANRSPYNCARDDTTDGSVLRFRYDDRGLAVSARAFDSSGKPSRKSLSYPHEERTRHDERGLEIESSYFDADGKPAPALGTVGRRTAEYDALGSPIRTRQYGTDGAPVEGSVGVHEMRTAYDDKHRLARHELRGVDGRYAAKPRVVIHHVEWPPGAVRMDVVREKVRLLNRYFDENEKELSTVDCTQIDKLCYR